MKIGIFQPNINNYPKIHEKLSKIENILNSNNIDILILPELYLSFYHSRETIINCSPEDVDFFKKKY
jgi:hypothetical protein